ncbi:hypothetical protein BKA81DRAFT_111337 [Phyllosticta paracitricarpa]
MGITLALSHCCPLPVPPPVIIYLPAGSPANHANKYSHHLPPTTALISTDLPKNPSTAPVSHSLTATSRHVVRHDTRPHSLISRPAFSSTKQPPFLSCSLLPPSLPPSLHPAHAAPRHATHTHFLRRRFVSYPTADDRRPTAQPQRADGVVFLRLVGYGCCGYVCG